MLPSMPGLPAAAAVLAAYLVGAVPFGLLLARIVAGVDPRRAGSGNVGATNVARLVGKRWFPVVLVLDAAKGAIAVLLLPSAAGVGGDAEPLVRVACAAAAVTGHVSSVFLRFRGGKGVATTAGAFVALSPFSLLAAVGVFGLTFSLSRFVSLASVVAAVALPVCAWQLNAPTEVVLFGALVALVIVFRHRGNLYRIARGEEPRVGDTPRADSPEEPERA